MSHSSAADMRYVAVDEQAAQRIQHCSSHARCLLYREVQSTDIQITNVPSQGVVRYRLT